VNETASISTGLVFLAYMLIVFGLTAVAGRFLSKPKSFVAEYFLGGRSMGSWALAMSFAATCISGGTFAGFPSLIYTHGWVLFLWIASYMVFPIVAMGLMGRRLNQLSHQTGAVTIPEILRERFDSPALSQFGSFAIVLFLTVNLVAQFKSGGIILDVLLSGTPGYRDVVLPAFERLPFVGEACRHAGTGYVFSLLVFSLTVVMYTSYGGFRAVVWTDVFQGLVMLIGVIVLLPAVLIKAGGLTHVNVQLREAPPSALVGTLAGNNVIEYSAQTARAVFIRHRQQLDAKLPVLVSVESAEDADTVVVHVRVDEAGRVLATANEVADAVRNHEEASLLVAANTLRSMGSTGDGAVLATDRPMRLVPGWTRLSGPGMTSEGLPFHSIGAAISFFFFWSLSGAGHPGFAVRLMAFKNSRDFRYSIVTVTLYFAMIYIPLVLIFVAARTLIHPAELVGGSDAVMPTVATRFVHPLLAGVMIAAPYSAVMSTVSSFLLVISASLVRDFYQRAFGRTESERSVTWGSYLATLSVGLIVTVAALDPPPFLQDIVVFSSSGISATFLVATFLSIYWKRMTLAGAWSAMLSGFGVVVGFHLPILLKRLGLGGSGLAIHPLGIDPFVWGCAVSLLLGVGVSWVSPRSPASQIRRYFGRAEPNESGSR
jgi:Na+/pantothenate symporter